MLVKLVLFVFQEKKIIFLWVTLNYVWILDSWRSLWKKQKRKDGICEDLSLSLSYLPLTNLTSYAISRHTSQHQLKFDTSWLNFDLQYHNRNDVAGGSLILWRKPNQVSLGGALWQASCGLGAVFGWNFDPSFSWSRRTRTRTREFYHRRAFAQETHCSMKGMLMNHVKFAFGVVTIYSACLSGSWK